MKCLWCGCDAKAHEHWRPGEDCGICGKDKCPVLIRTRIGLWLANLIKGW